jgi:hypothetical protein
MWPRIVTNFFIIKLTRCTNFTLILAWNSTCFRQFLCPSSAVYSLYTQQWCMSCRSVADFEQDQDGTAVPSWSCSKAVCTVPVWHIPLLSVQWINSWWCTEELSETCRVSWRNKFVKFIHLVDFITKQLNNIFFIFFSAKSSMIFWKFKSKISPRALCDVTLRIFKNY